MINFELHGHDITLATSVARQKHASALAFDASHRIKDCNKSSNFIITEYRSARVEDSTVVQGVLNRGRLCTTLLTIRDNGEGRLVAQSDTMHILSQNRLLSDPVKMVEMDTCRDLGGVHLLVRVRRMALCWPYNLRIAAASSPVLIRCSPHHLP